MKKFGIKESLAMLSIGRTTLYKHINILGIEPEKVSNQSFLTFDDIQKIQENLVGNFSSKKSTNKQPQEAEQEKQLIQHEQPSERTTQKPQNPEYFAISSIREIYEKQLAEIKAELTDERERNRQISLLLGQSQKVAEFAQNEVQRLREITETPAEPPKKSWWQVWK